MTIKPREVLSVSLDNAEFKALINVMHDLVKVYAAAQVRREEGTARNARFLKVFGLSEYEIADLLGVSPQAVNQALRRQKKGERK